MYKKEIISWFLTTMLHPCNVYNEYYAVTTIAVLEKAIPITNTLTNQCPFHPMNYKAKRLIIRMDMT